VTAAADAPARGGGALYAVLAALLSTQAVSTDLYLPAMPDLRADLGADVAATQLTLSVFIAAFAVSNLAYGPLSDRFGRRPILLAGMALYVVGTLGCLAAASVGQLLAFRVLQAMGACAGPVLARAVVRDMHPPERAASTLGYMSFAMSAVPVLAPSVGGALVGAFGWRSSFVALLVFGAVVLAGVWAAVPETNRSRGERRIDVARILADYAVLLRSRAFVGYTLCVSAGYWAIIAYLSSSPFVLIETVGLSPQGYGVAFGLTVSGFVVGTFLSGRLARRFGPARMAAAGAAFALAGGAATLACAVLLPPGVVQTVAPFAVFMVGAGLLLPNGFAGAIGPFPRMAGTASALAGFLQLGSSAVVGAVVGLVHDGTALPHGVVALAAGATAALAVAVLVRPGRAAT
jgi:DHA1 family bicyclomycin/chloramphenicol resistance-like MFS transporter